MIYLAVYIEGRIAVFTWVFGKSIKKSPGRLSSAGGISGEAARELDRPGPAAVQL
jgi:hypothetical protein